MTPHEASALLRRVEARKRRLQPQSPFTLFTLLYWMAVAAAVSTPLLGVLLYALGLLEFRR